MRIPAVRSTRLFVTTAATQMLIGLGVFALPTLLVRPGSTLALVKPVLPTATVAGGVVLLLLAQRPVRPALRRAAMVVPMIPHLWGLYLVTAAGWGPGITLYGLTAVGLLLAAVLPEDHGDHPPMPDLFSVVSALLNAVVGVQMLAFPRLVTAAPLPWFQGVLPVTGTVGLLAAAALLAPGRRPPWLRPDGLTVRAISTILPAVMAIAFGRGGMALGAITWGTWAVGGLLMPFRFGSQPFRADHDPDLFPAQLDRTMQWWLWVLGLSVVTVSGLGKAASIIDAPVLPALVIAVSLYATLAYSVFPHVGKPTQRVRVHLCFATLAVGVLTFVNRPMHHIFLTLLVVVPPLAVRTLGLREGRWFLVLAMAMILPAELLHLLTAPEPFLRALPDVVIESIVFIGAAYVGIGSAQGQRNALQALSAKQSQLEATLAVLEESEFKYRNLIEQLQDGFLLVKDERLQIVNPALARIVGYSVSEMVGAEFRLFFAPEELPELQRRYNARQQGLAVDTAYETQMLHRSGHRVPVRISANILRFHGEPATMAIVQDISEQNRVERALRESEERYRMVVELSPHAIVLHREGRVLFTNTAAAHLVGAQDPSKLVDCALVRVIHPDSIVVTQHRLARVEGGEKSIVPWETKLVRLDGTVAHVEVSSVLIPFGNDHATLTVCQDITERKRAQAQLMHLATYDPLTELYNRRRFHEEVERQVALDEQTGLSGAVLFLDIDQFKFINDSLGHQAGDDLLQSIGALLKSRLRRSDVVARLGGDEFALLLPHVTQTEAHAIAEGLREAIQDHDLVLCDRAVSVTASIGIVLYPDHGQSAQELLSRADLAMYQAKENGRNGASFFTPEVDQLARLEVHLGWERKIREALEQRKLRLLWQPIQHLPTSSVTRYELLLRMEDEDGQLIQPSEFLAVAERSGQIHAIDRWVVTQAIDLLARAKEAGRSLCLEVNLSGRAFSDDLMLPLIQQRLHATGIDPGYLVLEITETAAIGDLDRARAFVETLKEMGCQFALDDFGSGFSSFAYLKHLPVDYLKIDGSFIRNLQTDQSDQHLVRAMVEVARALGKQTVAEWVDSAATLSLLREYGVDFAQGYHIGRPGPGDE